MFSWFTHKALERSYHSLLGGRRFQVGTDFGEWAGYWHLPSADPLTRFGFKTLARALAGDTPGFKLIHNAEIDVSQCGQYNSTCMAISS